MSDERNDGGPAFAAIGVSSAGDVYHQNGMSLRDWFAGQALAGMVVNAKASGPEHLDALQNKLAELSYSMADAMLKARSAP